MGVAQYGSEGFSKLFLSTSTTAAASTEEKRSPIQHQEVRAAEDSQSEADPREILVRLKEEMRHQQGVLRNSHSGNTSQTTQIESALEVLREKIRDIEGSLLTRDSIRHQMIELSDSKSSTASPSLSSSLSQASNSSGSEALLEVKKTLDQLIAKKKMHRYHQSPQSRREVSPRDDRSFSAEASTIVSSTTIRDEEDEGHQQAENGSRQRHVKHPLLLPFMSKPYVFRRGSRCVIQDDRKLVILAERQMDVIERRLELAAMDSRKRVSALPRKRVHPSSNPSFSSITENAFGTEWNNRSHGAEPGALVRPPQDASRGAVEGLSSSQIVECSDGENRALTSASFPVHRRDPVSRSSDSKPSPGLLKEQQLAECLLINLDALQSNIQQMGGIIDTLFNLQSNDRSACDRRREMQQNSRKLSRSSSLLKASMSAKEVDANKSPRITASFEEEEGGEEQEEEEVETSRADLLLEEDSEKHRQFFYGPSAAAKHSDFEITAIDVEQDEQEQAEDESGDGASERREGGWGQDIYFINPHNKQHRSGGVPEEADSQEEEADDGDAEEAHDRPSSRHQDVAQNREYDESAYEYYDEEEDEDSAVAIGGEISHLLDEAEVEQPPEVENQEQEIPENYVLF